MALRECFSSILPFVWGHKCCSFARAGLGDHLDLILLAWHCILGWPDFLSLPMILCSRSREGVLVNQTPCVWASTGFTRNRQRCTCRFPTYHNSRRCLSHGSLGCKLWSCTVHTTCRTVPRSPDCHYLTFIERLYMAGTVPSACHKWSQEFSRHPYEVSLCVFYARGNWGSETTLRKLHKDHISRKK